MIPVNILEPLDTIQPEDWCRPLILMSMSGDLSDHYSFKSMYGGTPENNVKWVKVKHILGSCWFGSLIKEYNKEELMIPLEFIRGEIPFSHRLHMKEYNSINS